MSTLVQRIRGRYDRWTGDLRHRFRTDLTTRTRLFVVSTVGLVLLAGTALLVRVVVSDLDPVTVLSAVAGVLVVRAAMLRPAAPPHVHGLPGVPEPAVCPAPETPDRGTAVLAVRWLGALLAVAVAVAPPAIVAAFLLATVALAAPVLTDKVRLLRARLRLRRGLRAYAPHFVLGYGGYGGGPIHVGMWESHLLASGDRGVIVGLRAHYCAELRAAIGPAMPWIAAGSDVLGDMRLLTVPSMTTFFYVHNAPGHLKLMGVRSVRHVWLGHGDSDKSGSHHRRHLRYDVLVASGEAAIERYARHGVEIPRERFVLLGRPQSGDVLPAARAITEVDRPTVLYAPTWTGNGKMTNFSSIAQADRILQALVAADVNVVFRPHPVFLRDEFWAARLTELDDILRADHEDPASPRHHVWGEEAVRALSVADCMNRADALVSDVSSVVSDWLASGKPYLMVSMAHDLDEFPEQVPVAVGAYTVDRTLMRLPEVLEEMLRRDPIAVRRRELKVHVLGEYEGDGSARAFAAWVHEMAHTPVSRP